MTHQSTTRVLVALTATAAIACMSYVDARSAITEAGASSSHLELASLGQEASSIDSTPFLPELASEPRNHTRRALWAPTPRPAGGRMLTGLPASMRDSLSPRVIQRVLRVVRGEATYYADKFEGRLTASGVPFRQDEMFAAHRGFPFGTILRVTNTRNDRSVRVRVVDRGPFGARAAARNTIIDLSRRAARQLGYVHQGRAPVKIEVLEWGPGGGGAG